MITTIIGLIFGVATTFFMVLMGYGLHKWIEDNWVASFEGALGNAFVGIITTLIFPLLMGIIVAKYTASLFI
jgi:hypothetical protein